MLECYIKGRNLVNGVEKHFKISEGAVFVENYNETLDSGTIILPHLTEEIEIEPYDVVVIFSTLNSKHITNMRWLCVDTFICTQTSLDPAIYKYEISLFSETKLLEGILLPSLAITRKMDNPRSVYDYLDWYLNQYGTKIYSNNYGAYGNKYSFAERVYTRFYNVECPELQWNEPNLREVFNDLMMVDNCIVVVKEDVIDYIDISQSRGEITTAQRQGINYIQKSQSSQDYVSEIKTRIQNSVGEDEVTHICENITWRNFDTYLLTTDNVKVETAFPIWKLKKMSINIYANINIWCAVTEGPQPPIVYENYKTNYLIKDFYYDDINEIKKILEYGEWQTKDIFYAGQGSVMNYSTDYQNTCLYYKRGEKGIFNFEAKQEKIGFFWVPYTISVLELVLRRMEISRQLSLVIDEFLEEHPVYDDRSLYTVTAHITNLNWKRLSFEIEYETLGDYTLLASKMPMARNKRQVVDNQTNSYVNAKTFGVLEYMKANRLGNKLKLINGRYNTNENDLPTLAQTIDGSIIFRKEISVYENFFKVNYQATDNYILRDYFTGIKAKLRSWKILSGNETFIRNDNIKFYVNPNIQSISNATYKLPVYSTLQDYMNNFNYCVVKFRALNDIGNTLNYPDSNEIKYKGNNYNVDGYMLEFQKIICGNSILFSIKAFDNAIIGKYVADNEYDIGNGVKAMTQKNCKYVNDDGENIGGIIYFYKYYSLEGKTTEKIDALNNLLPAVAMSGENSGLSTLVAQIPFNFRKDNKEITQITIQFEMNNYANDIFLGKK